MHQAKHQIIYKSAWHTLFAYEQEASGTTIRIFAKQTIFSRKSGYVERKGSTSSRHVRFKLCGLDLSDSFEALSVTLALVKVFEFRQYGTGAKKLIMCFPTPNDDSLQLFCEIEAISKSFEGMRIGWIANKESRIVTKAHSMHVGYVHHLRNALHRAMNWLSPETQVELKELPDQKETR